MNMNFYLPTRVITGRDCIRRHAGQITAYGTRAMLITSPSAARRSGALADVTGVLDRAGVPWQLYETIRQNPTLTACQEAARLAADFGADFIIGIGGGSPLDAAKAVAVLTANPGMTQAELYSLVWPRPPLPVVCVGTTAGTGSEVTAVAVLTRSDGVKKSICRDSLFPVLSISDPGYTASLSDRFTRATAVDALSHCIESFFSRKANHISRCWALEGVRVLAGQLAFLVSHGSQALQYENREALYHGSLYGGLAISVTGTCYPHTIGYPLTEQFGIPHGIASAVFLPDFLQYNQQLDPVLMNRFCTGCGWELEALLTLIQAVTPDCTLTMSPAQIQALAPRWKNNKSLLNSPGTIRPDDIAALYTKLFGA